MRSVAVLGLLVAAVWASSLGVLVLIEAVVLRAVGASVLRSVVGSALFAAWAAAWYLLLKGLARRILRLPARARA